MGLIVNVSQDDHRAKFLGKRVEGDEEARTQIVQFGLASWVMGWFVVGDDDVFVQHGGFVPTPSSDQAVGRVRGYSIEPRTDTRLATKPAQVTKGLQVGVLGDVVGILGIANQSKGVGVRVVVRGANEVAERVMAALTGCHDSFVQIGHKTAKPSWTRRSRGRLERYRVSLWVV